MQHEIVLANGRIIDGCGNPWFRGDLAIDNGRVTTIAQPGKLSGRRILDACDRYIAPGFVDVHTHSDLTLMINRKAESMVRQGVTTEILGNCGLAAAPIIDKQKDQMLHYWDRLVEAPELSWSWRTFGEYLEALETGGIAINAGALLGHSTIRGAVMGMETRTPTDSELERMKKLTVEGMTAGAFGLSTGLVYPPGCFAGTDEIIALCKVVAGYGGIYSTHIRGERETMLPAVEEAIRIGREAGLVVQISHNCPKYGAPQDARANLGMIEAAREKGQDVTLDNDVHSDLGPSLFGCLPQRLHGLPIADIQAMLRDRQTRDSIRDEIVNDDRPGFGPAGLLRHGQWQRIFLLQAPETPEMVGRSIKVLAQETGKEPFDVYFDLIVANGHGAVGIFNYIDQENVKLLLKHPAMMICSDGSVSAPYGFLGEHPVYCPCDYGEFPGVLERFVRDEPVLQLEEAIRKMTSFPAQRFGLWDRGVLRPGMWADVVIFDLDRVRDRATCLYPYSYPLENYPHRYPEGIDFVMVNGVPVIEEGEHSGSLPGQVLRRRP
ncbi:MAG: D-aminoacylase [Anaerolineales bacterium]|nr:D-aminoacylase [Anaerolineales bacterium]